MSYNFPLSIIGFHSCDQEVGLRVLNGNDELKPSNNSWDWLGPGIYFWEQNPGRALEYGIESAQRLQFNKVPIKTPFVLGAIIELRNCLNLVESSSLQLLSSAYNSLKNGLHETGKELKENRGHNRALDCTVIQHIHKSHIKLGLQPYDTIRCAFPEGVEIYPGSAITSRLHIQVCVLNTECIKGYFLPKPLHVFNPHLQVA